MTCEKNKDKLDHKHFLAIDEDLLGFEPNGRENVLYSRKVNTSSYPNTVGEMSISKATCTPAFFEQTSQGETSSEA